MIDAGLVSAQTRKRLFWTNIPGIVQPEDRGLVLKDIMVKGEVDYKYWYHYPLKKLGEDKSVCAIMDFKNQEMNKRVFNPLFKSPTLTTCGGGGLQKKVLQNGQARKLTPLEYERLQCLPDNYTDCVADSHRYNTIGNAFNVEVVKHILSFIKK
jgi:DNA (cytosine-5)-methyltransferase 3A